MEGLFEGISIDDLASSESGVVEAATGSDIVDNTEKAKDPVVKADENIEANDEFTIDEDSLANSEDGIVEIDDVKDDKTDKGESGKEVKTPAKKGSPSNNINSLSSALVEAGVFSSLSKEDVDSITDVDTLLEAVSKQIKSNELKDLSETQKEYLEALRNGVESTTFLDRKKMADDYRGISDDKIKTNVNLAKELIKRTYLIDGLSDEKAEKLANIRVKEADYLSDAMEAKEILAKYEEDAIQEEIDEKKAENDKALLKEKENLSRLYSKINESADIIPGLKINSISKEKIYKSITGIHNVVNDKYPLNEVLSNYDSDEDYKVRLHAMHILTKGFTDFSKLEKTSKTKAILDLKNSLENDSVASNAGLPVNHSTGATSKSYKAALDAMNFKKY